MGVAIEVAGTKDEAAAKLEGVLAKLMLPVAGGLGPLPGCRVVAPKEMEQGSAAEAGGAVRFPLLVDQEREGDAGFLSENAGVVPVPKPDGRQACALFPEGLLVLAQLRDVLAAEDSTVVAEEDEDRGTLPPQRTEADLLTFRVGQDDPRKLSAE